MKTDQEKAWAGNFGDAYNIRSPGNEEANRVMFRSIFPKPPQSIIEFGAGTGANLRALRHLIPSAELAAIEVNESAAKQIQSTIPTADVFNTSVLNWEPERTWELAFTKGLLIHIPPEYLEKVYEKLYRASRDLILIAEYYNPTPVTVLYRGESAMLWKRDFAGEMMDRFNLALVDYGFVYHRDPYSQDDITWVLLQK